MKLNVREVRRQMLRQGLTQKALADKAGLSRQSINTILARTTCSLTSMSELAAGLGVDVETIWKED